MSAASATGAKKGSKLPLLAAALVVVLGGAGAGYWFLAGPGAGSDETTETAEREAPSKGKHAPSSFVDLPDMLVNLLSEDRRPRYLKLRMTLEIKDEKMAEEVRQLAPRVLDTFQTFLRALRPEDVEGAGGLQRLRDELLARVQFAIEPLRVENVLVREMLVQ